MSIPTQLRVGIRALDIRLGHIDSPGCNNPTELRIVHGTLACYRHTFHDVMSEVTAFLDNHPSEAVVMRVKRDASEKSIEDGNRFDSDVWSTTTA